MITLTINGEYINAFTHIDISTINQVRILRCTEPDKTYPSVTILPGINDNVVIMGGA